MITIVADRRAWQLFTKMLRESYAHCKHIHLQFCVSSFRYACLLILFHQNFDYCSPSHVLAATELIDFVGGATYFA